MRHLILAAIAAIALAGCVSPKALPPDATAQQAQDAKNAAVQANFDRGCTWTMGALQTAKPIVPALAPKLGAEGALALNALIAAGVEICGKPLDISKADAIVQRVYDIGGQIIALVIQAQSGSG